MQFSIESEDLEFQTILFHSVIFKKDFIRKTLLFAYLFIYLSTEDVFICFFFVDIFVRNQCKNCSYI